MDSFVFVIYVLCLSCFLDCSFQPAGKGLASWPSYVIFLCVFVAFSYGVLGQLWYLIVMIPDFGLLSLNMQVLSKLCPKAQLKMHLLLITCSG